MRNATAFYRGTPCLAGEIFAKGRVFSFALLTFFHNSFIVSKLNFWFNYVAY